MNQWHGKTIWVTGASSGIGRSLAIKLAELGANVVVSARRADALHNLAQILPERIFPMPADISDSSMIPQVQKQLMAQLESIDVAVLSAGVVEYENELNFEPEKYQSVFAANFFGLVNSVAIAMPLLKKSKHKPYLVGVTSLSMLIGLPRAEMYGSSKAAADYFLRSLRADIPPEDMDISIVRPGFVKTPMTAANDFSMPFVMEADEAVNRILKGMGRRTLIIEFPRRFALLIKLLAFLPRLWYTRIAPKMSRHKSLTNK